MEKQWFLSKTIWLNIILSVMGILTLVAQAIEKDPNLTLPGVMMLIVGALGVIVRYFFTSEPIAK